MSLETVYDVKTRFWVEDKGGKSLDGLVTSTRELQSATAAATAGFGRVAAAAAAAFGIGGATKALIGFNSHVEQARIGLSAMLQGNLGGSWETATSNANALYEEFQRFSVLTPVTTSEIMDFGKAVAVSTFTAGGSIRDLTKITEQGVIAAKAFGYGSAYASLELSEMLMGNVNKRMMFARQLLGIAHVSEEEFKKMDGAQRIGLIEKTINSDAMRNAAKAMGQSFEGVSTTFKDKLMIMVGKVGLPLFKALTAEVSRWNEWIDANTSKLEAFGTTLSHALVTGFSTVKDAIGFLVDHASLLLKIGEVWAAVKIGSFLGGLGGGGASMLAGGLGGFAGFFQKERADSMFTEGRAAGRGQQAVTMGNIGGNLPLVGAAAMAGVALGHLAYDALGLSDAIDPQRAELERLTKTTGVLDDAMRIAANRAAGQDGAGSSKFVTNLAAVTEIRRQQAQVLRDAQGGRFDGSNLSGTMRDAAMREHLRNSGVFDDDQIRRAMNGQNSREWMIHQTDTAMGSGLARSGVLPGVYAAKMGEAFVSLSPSLQKMVDLTAVNNEVLQYIAQKTAQGVAVNEQVVKQIVHLDAVRAKLLGTGKMADKPNVSITIQHLEVQSDDPDRMGFGLVEFFRDAAKNPSSAVSTLREG